MIKLKRPDLTDVGLLRANWWLTCGACSKGEYLDAQTNQAIRAAKLARKAGWRNLHIENGVGGWVCPDCMAKANTICY
jgi:hypothetical protein